MWGRGGLRPYRPIAPGRAGGRGGAWPGAIIRRRRLPPGANPAQVAAKRRGRRARPKPNERAWPSGQAAREGGSPSTPRPDDPPGGLALSIRAGLV